MASISSFHLLSLRTSPARLTLFAPVLKHGHLFANPSKPPPLCLPQHFAPTPKLRFSKQRVFCPVAASSPVQSSCSVLANLPTQQPVHAVPPLRSDPPSLLPVHVSRRPALPPAACTCQTTPRSYHCIEEQQQQEQKAPKAQELTRTSHAHPSCFTNSACARRINRNLHERGP